MKIHRFHTKELNLDTKTTTLTIADEGLVHQWNKVLRFSPGETVELFDEMGFSLLVKLTEINKKHAIFEILERRKKDIFQPNLSLFVSCIKKDNFEFLVQKVTEIGVREITPILSNRSQNKNLTIKRLQKISIEATEQSGGFLPPNICEITSLEAAILNVKKSGKRIIVCDFDGVFFTEIGRTLDSNYALFIGPEGGWGDQDKELFERHSIQKVSFGTRVLRTETAAIVAAWEFSK